MRDNWLASGIAASIIWALAAGNAGMHLAVAPAISAYRICLENPTADASTCQADLQRDWAAYSGHRLTYAASLGLAPIPLGWLIGWLAFARKRPTRAAMPGSLASAGG
jgi:hypothetical protein